MATTKRNSAAPVAVDPTKIETYPVQAASYVTGHENGFLTHAINVDTGAPLCRKVKASSILDDGLWDGEGCTARKPTCPCCAKRDPRKHD